MRILLGAAGFFLLAFTVTYAGEIGGDANRAWHTFRQAVLAKDSDHAATMTRFPLEVRGEDDSDPVQYFERKQFRRIFLRLIAQPQVVPHGDGYVRRSVVELVREKQSLTAKEFQSADQFRVYDFVFTRTKGGWFFVLGYIEE